MSSVYHVIAMNIECTPLIMIKAGRPHDFTWKTLIVSSFRNRFSFRNFSAHSVSLRSQGLVETNCLHNFNMFRQKYKSWAEYWATCGAKEKFRLLFNFIAELSRLIGCRFFIDGVVYWWSYAAYVLVIIYWILSTYTIVYHTWNGHFLRCLPCLCSFGVSVSVRFWTKKKDFFLSQTLPFLTLFLSKMLNEQSFSGYLPTINKKRFAFMRIPRLSFDYIFSDRSNPTLDSICSRSMDRAWTHFISVIAIIVLSLSCALIGPIYVFVHHAERATIFSLKMPFVEEDSLLEFVFNSIFQVMTGTFLVFGNIGVEGVGVLFTKTLQLSTEIIEVESNEFAAILATSDLSQQKMKFFVVKLFQRIQLVDR